MKSLKLSFTVLLILCFSVLSAQVIPGTKGRATKQITIKVSSISQETEEQSTQFKVPNPHWQIPDWTYDKSKVIHRQATIGNTSSIKKERENSPAPDTTFIGILDNGTSIPPDVNGAAGPNHIMQTLNPQVRISDKQGNELFTTSLNNFWSELPGTGTYDPKIVYDPYEDRWIMVSLSGSNAQNTRLYFGVSTTSNPLDEWHMFWIDPDTTNILWFDYPNLGFNKNFIALGGIMRNSAFEAVNYVVFSIDKMAAYAGDENPVYGRWENYFGSAIVPASTYDADQEEMYLVSTGDGNDDGYGYINLFKLSGEGNNPTFELKGSIGAPDPWENWSYENHPDFLPQLGSSEKLNSIDARMQTMVNRNDKLWAVHHIYIPADDPQRVAIQYWNLDTAGTVIERVRIDDPTNEYHFAFPSIAVNANEDVMIGHGVFSENQYASAAYSYKASFDEGSEMRTHFLYKEGLAPYYKTFGGGRNRWGDYSTTCVDPVLDINFWVLQEYVEVPTGNDIWGTWWAYIKPSFPPIAGFTSDETLIPVGETVDFIDLTLGEPTSWLWNFQGGDPSTSTEQNPSDILYDEEGVYEVSLIAVNDLGSDTLSVEDQITVSSSLLPEIEFESNKLVVCTGEIVQFTDLTQYSPIQWEWQFDPSTIEFVNGTDQNSQNPEVIFNVATTYAVTLTAWNLNGSSELTHFDMILAGGHLPYYKETFEPGELKEEEWTIVNPDNDITWEYSQIGGTLPGNTAAGIDLYNYTYFGQRDRLVSPPINLEGLSSAALEFQYAYAKRYPQLTDSLVVYLSSNCGESWTRIFTGGDDGSGNFATKELTEDFWPEVTSDWCMTGYGARCVSLDLTPWAGLPNVKIAFESWCGIGNPIFIDNVEISVFQDVTEKQEFDADMKIYPNPAHTKINIELSDDSNIQELQLINQLGQVVYQTKVNNGQSNLSIERSIHWPDGIYFIQAIGDSKVFVKEIVLSK